MFSFSMAELAVVLVITLVIFDLGKLPEVVKALGRDIQESRRLLRKNGRKKSIKDIS